MLPAVNTCIVGANAARGNRHVQRARTAHLHCASLFVRGDLQGCNVAPCVVRGVCSPPRGSFPSAVLCVVLPKGTLAWCTSTSTTREKPKDKTKDETKDKANCKKDTQLRSKRALTAG